MATMRFKPQMADWEERAKRRGLLVKRSNGVREKVAAAHRVQLEERLRRSWTNRLMRTFFFGAYISIGTWWVLIMTGKVFLVQNAIWLVRAYRAPFCWFSPEPDHFMLAGHMVMKQPLLALPIYAMIHFGLTLWLRLVTDKRLAVKL